MPTTRAFSLSILSVCVALSACSSSPNETPQPHPAKAPVKAAPLAGLGFGPVTDDAHVYFQSNDGIFTMPLAGGAPALLAPVTRASAGLVDATRDDLVLAKAEDLGAKGVRSTIMLVAKSSGALSAPFVTMDGFVASIGRDDASVYYQMSHASSVMRVPLAGGAPQQVADFGGAVDAFQVVDGQVYAGVTLADGSHEVRVASTSGGTPSTLVKTANRIFALRADGDRLLLLEQAGNGNAPQGDITIATAPRTGGAESPLATRTSVSPRGFAVAEGMIYWSEAGTLSSDGYNADGGQVLMMPETGGQPQVLDSGEANVSFGLVVGGSHLFWIQNGPYEAGKGWHDGAIMRADF